MGLGTRNLRLRRRGLQCGRPNETSVFPLPRPRLTRPQPQHLRRGGPRSVGRGRPGPMLRWLIGGGREPQGLAEKAALQTIGEDQGQNPYTELLVLEAHRDIALDWTVQACERTFWSPTAQLDAQQEIKLFQKQNDISINHFTCDEENIFAAVGRGLYVYNLQLKRVIACQKTAHDSNIPRWRAAHLGCPGLDSCEASSQLLLTASADRTVGVWDCDTGRQIQRVTCFQSTVKCLTVLQRLDIWLSGGSDLGVWNRKLDLLCKTSHLSDTGISALVEIPGNCVAAAVGRELIIFRLVTPTEELPEWDIIEVKRLLDHQDNILSLANINDTGFVTGSHVGELLIWDALQMSWGKHPPARQTRRPLKVTGVHPLAVYFG